MPSPFDFSPGTPILWRRPPAFTFERYRLRVIEGPDQGLVCTADEPELSIGTAQGNHLVLHDPGVSRHHCVIEVGVTGYRLRDLASTNGTFLGDYQIESAWLGSTATLRLGVSRLSFERLPDRVDEPLPASGGFGRIIGQSVAMGRVLSILPRLAAGDSTLLIEGETGTGKGLVAESIHEASPRAGGPFVPVDCGAIALGLIESELFGHERGAFTGAETARPGAFEAADGGTVFLDEIGELPLEMQPKLLRVIETRAVRRVGGRALKRLDVRIIAATNRDLRRAVNSGVFRADLYYRLNVVRLHLPPLRERTEDIPLLARQFFAELAGPAAPFPEPLMERLVRQEWPGNVRELRNAIERIVVLPELPDLDAAPAAGDSFDSRLSFREARSRAAAEWEKHYLRQLMAHVDGNLSAASRLTRIDRTHLRMLLTRHGLRPDKG